MKKTFTILTIIVFFFSQVAYYFVYSVVRYFEQEKMEAHLLRTIPEKECEIINLTSNSNNFYWEKEGEIFILNGVMYDVAKKRTANGNEYAYCITENKETEMLDDLTLKFSNADESGKDFSLSFSEECILVYKHDPELLVLLTSVIFPGYCSTLADRSTNVILPPPDFIV